MTLKDRELRIGDAVRHFKGGKYRILGTATHTETGETLVLYRKTWEADTVFARPEEMFCSPVDREMYPGAEQKYQMEKI